MRLCVALSPSLSLSLPLDRSIARIMHINLVCLQAKWIRIGRLQHKNPGYFDESSSWNAHLQQLQDIRWYSHCHVKGGFLEHRYCHLILPLNPKAVNKSVKAKLKKRLGLPPARNIGSKETKAAMKRLDRRMPLGELEDFWARGDWVGWVWWCLLCFFFLRTPKG